MAKGINWGPDLGAPVLVTAVDLILETTAPEYTKWGTGIMAIGGYLGNQFDWGGDFIKNVGIAALPAAAKNVYDWAKAGMATRPNRKVAFRRSPVSHYPAEAPSAPFTGVKLT